MYRFYEIGLRGTPDQVERFSEQIKENDSRFFSVAYNGMTERSFRAHAGMFSSAFDLTSVQELAREWSLKFPSAESFYYLESLLKGGLQELRYGSYSSGNLSSIGLINSHEEHLTHFGKTRPCECEHRTMQSDPNPHRAPYVDCPIRLNPPVKWAVENIMEASQWIGRR